MNTTLSSEGFYGDGSMASLDGLSVELSQETDQDAIEDLGKVVTSEAVEVIASGCPNPTGCKKTGCTGACGEGAISFLA